MSLQRVCCSYSKRAATIQCKLHYVEFQLLRITVTYETSGCTHYLYTLHLSGSHVQHHLQLHKEQPRLAPHFNHTQDHHTTMWDMAHTCCAMQFLLPLEPREAAGGSISVYDCHKVGKVRFNTTGSTEVCTPLLIMHYNRWDDNYCSNILFTSM